MKHRVYPYPQTPIMHTCSRQIFTKYIRANASILPNTGCRHLPL